MTLRLYIGNQRFSSWSMRPWIVLHASGLPFETIVLRFDDPAFSAKVPAPSSKVPVLVDGQLVVHESLAIGEYVAERAPSAGLWPAGSAERALARSLAAEMHAGFASLRTECPMDLCRSDPEGSFRISAAARREIARLDEIFGGAGTHEGGPFLFGRFGIVDAMFAPVVTRFLTYGLPLSEAARSYARALRSLGAVEAWYRAGERERDLGWGHYRQGQVTSHVDAATDVAQRWADAWNRRDVEAVLAHFAEDAVFRSPRALELVGVAEVRGKSALRAYWTEAAKRLPPDLRFEIERVDPAPETASLTVRYVRRRGEHTASACEILTFDVRSRLVISGEAFYGA